MRRKIVMSHLHPDGAYVLAYRETKRMRRWLAWCRGNKRNVKFVTLTYDPKPYVYKVAPDDLPEYMYDIAKDSRHVARFMKRVEEFSGSSLKGKWRAKMEFHDTGILHFHLLIRDMPYVQQCDLQNLWGHGIVDIRKARIKHASYIAKYQSKAGGYPAFLYNKPRRSVQIWGTSHGFFDVIKEQDSNLAPKTNSKAEDRSYRLAAYENNYNPSETIGQVLERARTTFIVKDEVGCVKEYIARDSEVICALWMMKFEQKNKRFGWYEYDMTWHHLERVMDTVREVRHLQSAIENEQLNEIAYCDDDYIEQYEQRERAAGRRKTARINASEASRFSCSILQDCAQNKVVISAEYNVKKIDLEACGIPFEEWPDEYAPF